MSSSNLLKGFGAGADVMGQLANDKALRRKSTGTVRGFDITDGELVEDFVVPIEGTSSPGTEAKDVPVPHSLNRVPKGAIILKATLDTGDKSTFVTRTTLTHVYITSYMGRSITLWIV